MNMYHHTSPVLTSVRDLNPLTLPMLGEERGHDILIAGMFSCLLSLRGGRVLYLSRIRGRDAHLDAPR